MRGPRRVLSSKPANVRAAHKTPPARTPWRRPVRDNGHRIAHPRRRAELGFCTRCQNPVRAGHRDDCPFNRAREAL